MFNLQYFIAGYFPPVWFVEDEDGLLPEERKPDVIQVVGSCGGSAYDGRKEKRRKRKLLEQEEDDIEEIMLVIQCFLGAQSISCQ